MQSVLTYEKIQGEDNPVDGLAKHVRQELGERYARTVSLKLGADRAKTGLQLAGQG